MKNVVVQKFGGTSVGSIEKIKKVAQRIKDYKEQGSDLVVVVSAMGNTTNDLIGMAKEVTEHPSPREMDMLISTGEQISISLLAIALHNLGCKAISLTGGQSGIITNNYHKKARISTIDTTRIKRELDDGNIVIIAGFQGITEDYDITTLGRGGSDTTAVAVACALKASQCEIYTDVEGVYTTDPRYCPDAQKLNEISYDEMLELAKLGANVLHPRSVEIASNYKLPLIVRSSFNNNGGTLITEVKKMEKVLIRGIALDDDIVRFTVTKVPDKPGIAFKLFSILSKENIQIDTIIQNLNHDEFNDISYTVPVEDFEKTLDISTKFAQQFDQSDVLYKKNVSKLSIVGTGISGNAEVASKYFETLFKLGINIEMISTSEIKISCIIESKNSKKAINEIHKAFELDKINIL
jgi:aspartate kinase